MFRNTHWSFMNTRAAARLVALTVLLIGSERIGRAQVFQPLGDLPGGGNSRSHAYGVSADGLWVVGYGKSGSGWEAFLWYSTANAMQGLGDLPGGSFFSHGNAISDDGLVVVGRSDSTTESSIGVAYRWDGVHGMQELGDLPGGELWSEAHAVSADGSVVVGISGSTAGGEAFLWDPVLGMQGLGYLPGGTSSNATGVSADGTTVVGTSSSAIGSQAFLWDAVNGMQGLGTLPSASGSVGQDISADGLLVVGTSGARAFLWNANTGMQDLGTIPGMFGGNALAISGNGMVVGGEAYTPSVQRAFVWNSADGMRFLEEVLANDYGVILPGWQLYRVTDFSFDGAVIVGHAYNPDDNHEAWRVDLNALDFRKWTISGPDRNRDGMVDQEVEVGLTEPTEYSFRIRVNRPDLPQGMVRDTVPAEWEVVSCVPEHRDDPVAVYPQDRSANSATVIDWMPERNQGRLQVTIRTRPIPVEGGITQRSGKTPPGTHYPQFPGKLMINWGATLLDEPDRPFFDSGNPLQTEPLSVQAVERLDGSTGIRR